jgi:hypothetical protein
MIENKGKYDQTGEIKRFKKSCKGKIKELNLGIKVRLGDNKTNNVVDYY